MQSLHVKDHVTGSGVTGEERCTQWVPQALVHKKNKENVHLYNLRRRLPEWLAAQWVESRLPHALPEQERALLQALYREQPHPSGSAERGYALHLPQLVPGSRTEAGLVALSQALEAVPELPREEVFYVNMHVDSHHPYFFEHGNDHVPAIMVLEAARQACMASMHAFGHVPLSDVRFLVSEIRTSFSRYLELAPPITLKCVAGNLRVRSGYWSQVAFDVQVLQEGSSAVHVHMAGKTMTERAYRKIRGGAMDPNP
jgi:hypothetical protein